MVARQRATDARIGFGPSSRRIRRCLYRYTMCKRRAKRLLKRRDQCAPSTGVLVAHASATESSTGSGRSSHGRPPFRNVGTFGSDHQWGNVERSSVKAGAMALREHSTGPSVHRQALRETLRRPSGAGSHSASFAAAFRRPAVGPQGSYLVDPASSHMLVSKIKPCMSKYKLLYTVKLRMAH